MPIPNWNWLRTSLLATNKGTAKFNSILAIPAIFITIPPPAVHRTLSVNIFMFSLMSPSESKRVRIRCTECRENEFRKDQWPLRIEYLSLRRYCPGCRRLRSRATWIIRRNCFVPVWMAVVCRGGEPEPSRYFHRWRCHRHAGRSLASRNHGDSAVRRGKNDRLYLFACRCLCPAKSRLELPVESSQMIFVNDYSFCCIKYHRCHRGKIWCRLTSHSYGDQLFCIENSFLTKPISPPSPAISAVSFTSDPAVGNIVSSRRSIEHMYLSADFKLGPHCSRTRKDACFDDVISRYAASYWKLCFREPAPPGLTARSTMKPLSFSL